MGVQGGGFKGVGLKVCVYVCGGARVCVSVCMCVCGGGGGGACVWGGLGVGLHSCLSKAQAAGTSAHDGSAGKVRGAGISIVTVYGLAPAKALRLKAYADMMYWPLFELSSCSYVWAGLNFQ